MESNQNWYRFYTAGHFGYPQPEDSYKQVTYDTSIYCDRCGIGGIQNNPFRFRTAPKKTKHFLKLNWVFDEIFISPEVKGVFEQEKIEGLSYLHPVINKTGENIENLYQIKVDTILAKGVFLNSLNTVTCKEDNEESHIKIGGGPLRYPPDYPFCGRVKYNYPKEKNITFNKQIFESIPDIVKSNEFFGSGGQAYRLILVSQKIYNIVKSNKWRGVLLEPITLK